ncbi:MAG: hypothetical protein KKH52_01350 [Nanoarchaeota archaeon]|nr:hypothetical protein [Nanoarchaeota archaeon]MBU1622017.1 hypothetical protein [Nanoarchaeota archaeon]MBU1974022.1 hypothetical protein [Nanoarchaeota archaeon]
MIKKLLTGAALAAAMWGTANTTYAQDGDDNTETTITGTFEPTGNDEAIIEEQTLPPTLPDDSGVPAGPGGDGDDNGNCLTPGLVEVVTSECDPSSSINGSQIITTVYSLIGNVNVDNDVEVSDVIGSQAIVEGNGVAIVGNVENNGNLAGQMRDYNERVSDLALDLENLEGTLMQYMQDNFLSLEEATSLKTELIGVISEVYALGLAVEANGESINTVEEALEDLDGRFEAYIDNLSERVDVLEDDAIFYNLGLGATTNFSALSPRARAGICTALGDIDGCLVATYGGLETDETERINQDNGGVSTTGQVNSTTTRDGGLGLGFSIPTGSPFDIVFGVEATLGRYSEITDAVVSSQSGLSGPANENRIDETVFGGSAYVGARLNVGGGFGITVLGEYDSLTGGPAGVVSFGYTSSNRDE